MNPNESKTQPGVCGDCDEQARVEIESGLCWQCSMKGLKPESVDKQRSDVDSLYGRMI